MQYWGSPELAARETETRGIIKRPGKERLDFVYYDKPTDSFLPMQEFNISQNKKVIQPNGTDKVIFGGIPQNTKMYLDKSPYFASSPADAVSDPSGILELTADDPGVYTVNFRKYGYAWISLNVEATE